MTIVQSEPADRAVERLPVIGHWIDGAPRPSTSGRTAPVFDPATRHRTERRGIDLGFPQND